MDRRHMSGLQDIGAACCLVDVHVEDAIAGKEGIVDMHLRELILHLVCVGGVAREPERLAIDLHEEADTLILRMVRILGDGGFDREGAEGLRNIGIRVGVGIHVLPDDASRLSGGKIERVVVVVLMRHEDEVCRLVVALSGIGVDIADGSRIRGEPQASVSLIQQLSHTCPFLRCLTELVCTNISAHSFFKATFGIWPEEAGSACATGYNWNVLHFRG